VSELANLISKAIAAADPSIEAALETDRQAHLDWVLLTARAAAETDIILHSAISAARSAGFTWQELGSALGMSKQAAQQRFGSTRTPRPRHAAAP
jgi:hypothetical protein